VGTDETRGAARITLLHRRRERATIRAAAANPTVSPTMIPMSVGLFGSITHVALALVLTALLITIPDEQHDGTLLEMMLHCSGVGQEKFAQDGVVVWITVAALVELINEDDVVEPLSGASTEPDVVEPVSAEPDVVKPVIAEPDVVEPLSAEPDVVKPVIAEPDVVEPLSAEPDVVKPVIAVPDLVEPLNPEADVVKPLNPEADVVEPITVDEDEVDEPPSPVEVV